MGENPFLLEGEKGLLFSGSHVRTNALALVLISSPTSAVTTSCRVTPSLGAKSRSALRTDLAPSPSHSTHKAPVRVREISTLLPFLDRRIG